jgi:hypothetical protein
MPPARAIRLQGRIELVNFLFFLTGAAPRQVLKKELTLFTCKPDKNAGAMATALTTAGSDFREWSRRSRSASGVCKR